MGEFVAGVGFVTSLIMFASALFLFILLIILSFTVFGIQERLDMTNKLLEGILHNSGFIQHEVQKTNQILKAVHNVQE